MGKAAALGLALLVGAALPAWAGHDEDRGGWHHDHGRHLGQMKRDRDGRWDVDDGPRGYYAAPRGYYAPPPVYRDEPGISVFIPFH